MHGCKLWALIIPTIFLSFFCAGCFTENKPKNVLSEAASATSSSAESVVSMGEPAIRAIASDKFDVSAAESQAAAQAQSSSNLPPVSVEPQQPQAAAQPATPGVSDMLAAPRKWGALTDTLKTYADHEGVQQYAAYQITGALGYRGKLSSPQVMQFADLGSQYLTSLQSLTPQDVPQELAETGCFMQLCVTDAGQTYQYEFYESGRIYTKQNGKLYYLGADPGFAFSRIMNLVYCEMDEATKLSGGATPPPVFIPEDAAIGNTVSLQDIPSLKRSYSVADFSLAISLDAYSEETSPVVISDTATKEKIFKILSETWDAETAELVSGSGPMLYLYNQQETLHFQVMGNHLRNFQVDNAAIWFALDDDFYTTLQFAVAHEIAERLSSVSR